MKNKQKVLVATTLLGILSLPIIGAASFFGTEHLSAAHAATSNDEVPLKQYQESDFDGYTQALDSEISLSISQSTTTSTSQSTSITFKSIVPIGFRTSKVNYTVVIEDDNFTGDTSNPASADYSTFYETLDDDGNPVQLPLFNGAIFDIIGSTSANNKKVYLPTYMVRNTTNSKLAIEVTSINENALNSATNYDKVTDVFIPNTIVNVASNAFNNVPDTVTIHCEFESKPESWPEDWTDAKNVEFSIDSYNKQNEKKVGVLSTPTINGDGESKNFILGYKSNPEFSGEQYNKPLVFAYDLVTVNDSDEEISREKIFISLPLTTTTTNPYDACGLGINKVSYSRNVNVKLLDNQHIDDSSIYVYNIFYAFIPSNSNSFTIDLDHPFYAKAKVSYSGKTELSSLISYRFDRNTTFMGYSMFSMKVDKNLSITSEAYPEPHSLYLDVMPVSYEQNKLTINSGETRIRYSLYNIYNSSYHFQYKHNGEIVDKVVPISSVISYATIDNDKNNSISILVKNSEVGPGFSADKVTLFELQDLTIQMDLYSVSNSGTVSIIGKSVFNRTFAYLTVYDDGVKKSFSIDLFFIVFYLIYLLIYALCAFLYYRYRKEKYKNDEFRRVNNKKYIKSAILGGLGLGEVIGAILFIICRTSLLKNTIVVFNPTDPFVIGFSIVAFIIIGYFIVFMVNTIKADRQRRKAIKLKLDEDVAEDGTN